MKCHPPPAGTYIGCDELGEANGKFDRSCQRKYVAEDFIREKAVVLGSERDLFQLLSSVLRVAQFRVSRSCLPVS